MLRSIFQRFRSDQQKTSTSFRSLLSGIAFTVISLLMSVNAQERPNTRNLPDPQTVYEALSQQRGLQDAPTSSQKGQWSSQGARALPSSRAERISDAAIHKDYLAYQAQQLNINQAFAAKNNNAYAVAKAQCWLDVSFHEYTRNDRSSFVEEAFAESVAITQALQSGKGEPWLKTPYLNGTANYASLATPSNNNTYNKPLLELEARLLKLNVYQKECRPAALACAEVETIHAINEYSQGGYRHAEPYIVMADTFLKQIEPCQPPPPKVVYVPPKSVAMPQVTLPQRVHFAFDLYFISKPTAAVLEQIVSALKADKGLRLRAVGHTDLRASVGYNLELSLRRVAAIQTYMRMAGVDAGQMQFGHEGKSKLDKPGLVEGDHQYNRRVEFELVPGSSPAVLVPQFTDIQACGELTLRRCPKVKHAPQDKIKAQDMRTYKPDYLEEEKNTPQQRKNKQINSVKPVSTTVQQSR